MYPQLAHCESERAVRQEPQHLGAWELAQRGWWHYNRMTKEDDRKALSFIDRATELDPNFVWANFALVMAYSLTGQRDNMIAAAELAVRLAPGSSLAQYALGLVVAMTGRPDEGVASIEKAIRLSPRDPWMFEFLAVLSTAHSGAARYEEAAELARQSLQRKPDCPWPLDILAASLVHLGRVDEARSTVEGMLRTTPDHSIVTLRLVFQTADGDLLDRLFDGLRQAGLPE